MTATGFLVGILAGIGVLAIAAALAIIIIVRKVKQMDHDHTQMAATSKIRGFSEFKKLVNNSLDTAPVYSNISAFFPFPSVDSSSKWQVEKTS